MSKHASGKQILTNRVNGVVKSFETFKTSLKNNRDTITEEEIEKMLNYLEKTTTTEIANLRRIYKEEDNLFSF